MTASELTYALSAAVGMLGHHLTVTSSQDKLRRVTVLEVSFRRRESDRKAVAKVLVSDEQQVAYPETLSRTLNTLLDAIVPADVRADADKVRHRILKSGPLQLEMVGGMHDGQLITAPVDADGWPPIQLALPGMLIVDWRAIDALEPAAPAPVDSYHRGFVDPVRMHWMYAKEKS